MAILTPEQEKKKRELFESMSPKAQRRILKRGYDAWDPFMPPKEPLAYKLKQEAKGETVQFDSGHDLYERYFAGKRLTDYSPEYVKGVLEIAEGLHRHLDRYRGMYDFCLWYFSWRHQRQQEEDAD